MNDYKTKKLAEFQDKFTLNKEGLELSVNATAYILKQFISDLIDEFSGAIPEELEYDDGYADGWNKCRATLINNLNNK